MAVKTVADRAGISASGAATGDTINIANKNETWKVASSKLYVPSSTITVKLSNGNIAYLSTPDTVARNESGAVPEFSSTIAYTAGSMVRRNGALFVAKQNMFSGSFAQEQRIEVQPGSNNSIVTRIVRLRPSSPGNSYFNNPSVTLGQWVIMMEIKDTQSKLSMTRLTDNSNATDYLRAVTEMQVGTATTKTVSLHSGTLSKTSGLTIGDTTEISSGKLDFSAKTIVGFPKTGGVLEINWGSNLTSVNTGWAVITYTGPELP